MTRCLQQRSYLAAMAMCGLIFGSGVVQPTTATGASAASSDSQSSWTLQKIHVVDDKGNPVPNPEAIIVPAAHPTLGSVKKIGTSDGVISISQSDAYGMLAKLTYEKDFEVLIRAKGKAPSVLNWKKPTSSPLQAQLSAGKPIEIQISDKDGNPPPEGISFEILPSVFGISTASANRPPDSKDEKPSPWIEPISPGKYRIGLGETTVPLKFMLQQPDYLVAYHADISTTEALKTGKLAYKLPAPAKLQVTVKMPEKLQPAPQGKTLFVDVMKLIELDDNNRAYLDVASKNFPLTGKSVVAEFTDIAPGSYYVSVQETSKDAGPSSGNSSISFRAGEELKLKAGDTTKQEFEFKQFDPSSLYGDYVATVKVVTQKGEPAAGMKYRLTTYLPDFREYYVVTSGTLDKDGQTTLPGVNPETRTGFDLTKDQQYGDRIGSFRPKSGETSGTFEFKLPPSAGDRAPDITLVDVNTSEAVTLSSLRGKVVFLDFWATWCGPCQGPMAHNQKVLEENGKRWGDRVVIAGASIDDKPETVVEHVKKNGWGDVRQLWCGKDSFSSKPSTIYAIRGVPTAFLIDAEGTIVWRGHPGSYELVEKIDELLDKK